MEPVPVDELEFRVRPGWEGLCDGHEDPDLAYDAYYLGKVFTGLAVERNDAWAFYELSNYQDGALAGEQTEHWNSGGLKERCTYVERAPHGEYEARFEDGSKHKLGCHGEQGWERVFRAAGTLSYRRDSAHAIEEHFHENGKLKRRSEGQFSSKPHRKSRVQLFAAEGDLVFSEYDGGYFRYEDGSYATGNYEFNQPVLLEQHLKLVADQHFRRGVTYWVHDLCKREPQQGAAVIGKLLGHDNLHVRSDFLNIVRFQKIVACLPQVRACLGDLRVAPYEPSIYPTGGGRQQSLSIDELARRALEAVDPEARC